MTRKNEITLPADNSPQSDSAMHGHDERPASNSRRRLLGALGAVTGALTVGASSTVLADNHAKAGGHKGMGDGHAKQHAFVVPATTESRCATCAFWGGQRHTNRERTQVHVQSLGMCNNPASPNFHTVTSPDTGPMENWVRWTALEV